MSAEILKKELPSPATPKDVVHIAKLYKESKAYMESAKAKLRTREYSESVAQYDRSTAQTDLGLLSSIVCNTLTVVIRDVDDSSRPIDVDWELSLYMLFCAWIVNFGFVYPPSKILHFYWLSSPTSLDLYDQEEEDPEEASQLKQEIADTVYHKQWQCLIEAAVCDVAINYSFHPPLTSEIRLLPSASHGFLS